MQLEQLKNDLDELVRRIVSEVHPLRIILFGSAVRDELNVDSDLDILVVVPEGTNRRKTMQFIHTLMFGISMPVDVLVATPADIERHRDNIGLIYRTILDEGRELYAA